VANLENRRIVLARRPDGKPVPDCFRFERVPVPEIRAGEILLRTVWLSLDPYMRGRMSEGPSYAPPVQVGAVMVGGTVSRVERSMHPGYAPGELVVAYAGWQDYGVSDTRGLVKIPAGSERPSHWLGILGIPGFTAYMGLLDIGAPQPGETVVVAAATGGVGSVVGQIAKINGCRAVGIAGGPEKCAFAVESLGFDACIDHYAPSLPERLAEVCPNGIDVYFENVGGKVLQAVVPLLNTRARIPLCGLISQYNEPDADGPDRSQQLMRTLLTKRVTVRGFIINLDYGRRFDEFVGAMRPWVESGRLTYREDVVEGLENAPQAFIGLLAGKNFGKLLVRVHS
jgi:NADPH-dependent curcumin reductase CurA